MKRILFITAIAAIFAACGSTTEKSAKDAQEATTEVVITNLQELMATPDNFVDKELQLEGLITHVCSHSGKRMFMQNPEGDLKLKITTNEEMGPFDKALEGSNVQVIGVFKEERIDAADVDQMEKDLLEGQEVEATHDHSHGDGHEDATEDEELQAKLDNLNAMREEIKASEKGYISEYWMVCNEHTPIAE
jgi:hypothetical protein